MTKLIVTTFLLLFGCSTIHAQQTGRMETDRPDQTECPFVTRLHFFQAELGLNYEKEKGLATLVHPTALWKYGASKKFELRLITEIISAETALLIPTGNDFITGLLPVHLGAKLSLAEEKGWLPKTSFLFHIAAPKIAGKKFRATKWAPNFRFVMQNTLSENIGLGYNLGAEWDGESSTPSWVYTISPGFNLGKKWYGYIEAFGSVRKNEKPEHSIDGGFAYYFSDDAKIDFSGGYGLSDETKDWYIALGFSFRLKTTKKK